MHEPVLLEAVVQWLRPERGGMFVDCTVGLGGHSRALLERGATRLVGLDRDANALTLARAALERWSDQVELVHADFRDLPAVLDARGIATIDGALADLGLSSMQLDAEGRGFSFRRDEPLDMRMDPSSGATAAELLATADEREIADVIFLYGEERHSRRIARAIVNARERAPIERTGQLAEIVRRAAGGGRWHRIDPATRTFQAVRIWVNRELEGLDTFLQVTARRLSEGARLAVISFHSLEDRIVKQTFRALDRPPSGEPAIVRVLTKHPVTPEEDEVRRNPRARSAKLRVAERR